MSTPAGFEPHLGSPASTLCWHASPSAMYAGRGSGGGGRGGPPAPRGSRGTARGPTAAPPLRHVSVRHVSVRHVSVRHVSGRRVSGRRGPDRRPDRHPPPATRLLYGGGDAKGSPADLAGFTRLRGADVVLPDNTRVQQEQIGRLYLPIERKRALTNSPVTPLRNESRKQPTPSYESIQTAVDLNIHPVALNIHHIALNIHPVALNIHPIALNILSGMFRRTPGRCFTSKFGERGGSLVCRTQ
eukprot:1188881-Prorocentrum_minimum.AAC.1